ncbi:MAG: hypothetical protein U0835_01690 [Isosphaeraceae bacterium]
MKVASADYNANAVVFACLRDLADLYRKTGRPVEALRVDERLQTMAAPWVAAAATAQSARPFWRDAHRRAAETLTALGRHHEAAARLEAALKAAPEAERPALHLYLARVRLAAGDPAAARASADLAAKAADLDDEAGRLREEIARAP